ncbi:MAG: quinone oxidoreductase [Pelagibacteraceae bacterium]|jgi:NADPH2:quinone reductase|nr:quinone oxidoreductase [Pelagibacteraceae bacterium]MBT5214316.1 quinone oxidoreductase [Pelagibacteraceae bacterium]MBT6197367.1 quinone oxidoreductase [Pelagibacteraceae bacterium]
MPKQIVISELGGPEVLKYQNYDLPSNIKNNEVRIKHTAIGLNYIDTYHRSGIYPLPSTLPVCPGLEAAGEVVDIGVNVKAFKIGDRVAYASPPMGAYCDIRDFPENKLINIPNFLKNDDVASILLQGMTVEYLFERLYKIQKNEFILFHAAAGGVGLVASQWAKSIGCKMIGTVSTKEKGELAKEHGCEYIINYKEENVSKKVMEITNNEGVQVVYDGVGRDTFLESINSLSVRGLLVSFGQSSGMVDKLDLHQIFNPKSLFYTRPNLMNYTLNNEELKECSNKLFEKMRIGEIKSNIFKKIKLEEAQKAHEILQSRKSFGSIILEP